MPNPSATARPPATPTLRLTRLEVVTLEALQEVRPPDTILFISAGGVASQRLFHVDDTTAESIISVLLVGDDIQVVTKDRELVNAFYTAVQSLAILAGIETTITQGEEWIQ